MRDAWAHHASFHSCLILRSFQNQTHLHLTFFFYSTHIPKRFKHQATNRVWGKFCFREQIKSQNMSLLVKRYLYLFQTSCLSSFQPKYLLENYEIPVRLSELTGTNTQVTNCDNSFDKISNEKKKTLARCRCLMQKVQENEMEPDWINYHQHTLSIYLPQLFFSVWHTKVSPASSDFEARRSSWLAFGNWLIGCCSSLLSWPASRGWLNLNFFCFLLKGRMVESWDKLWFNNAR